MPNTGRFIDGTSTDALLMTAPRRATSQMLRCTVKNWLAAKKHGYRDRFKGEHDWLRIFVLGCVLLAFSVLSIADILATRQLFSDAPGDVFLYSGVAIVFMMAKIIPSIICADWMVEGLLYICVGFSVTLDESYGHLPIPILIVVLLIMLGAIRLWLGTTTAMGAAGSWLLCSGGIAITGAFAVLLSWFAQIPVPPRIICTVDLLLHAISIIGFSLAIRDLGQHGMTS